MFKNYFITAFRNFWRNKVFSLINVIGLAIGISASLVIFLIVSYDFSFDKFQKDRDRIYRVTSNMHFPDQDFKNSGVPLPLPEAVKREVPGIETAAAFRLGGGDLNVAIQSNNNTKPAIFRKQPHIVYADNNYFKLISYQWLAGSPQTSLKEPFKVVLTESRAKTYFPSQDVTKDIGKIITYNDSIKATVSGIVKDLDEITDFTFNEFISYSTIENSGLKDNIGWGQWGSISSTSQFLIKLKPGIQPNVIAKKINDVRKRNEKDAYLQTTHYLQPLSGIHFDEEFDNFSQRQAHLPTLYGLLVVDAILLILGCINFINLTTAHSVQRAKEIGIRKTMGGSKHQLIIQFLSETFLLTVLATLLSLVIIPFLLKIFSDFIPPEIHINMIAQPHVILFIIALIVVVTFFSGFYPSLILSGYKPVSVLKNQVGNSAKTRKSWLRKSLTITQFTIAQAFVIATLIVGKQINYSINKDLGFKKDGIVVIDLPWHKSIDVNKQKVLLQEISSIRQIQKAVLAGSTPATQNYSIMTMKFNDGKKDIETTVEVKYADSAYFSLYNMKLIAGKFLSPSDSVREYLINENFARFLGFKNPADAVGKILGGSGSSTMIVGVLKDFYARSMHDPIKPLVFTANSSDYSNLHVLLKPDVDGNTWETGIAKIKNAFKHIYPDEDFNYAFFDDSIAQFYKSEQDTSSLLTWATALAIFISCLGLLGLVIYTTNQRTKEIGVRKVLGASVAQIVTLISKDFIKLIIIAFVIAAPLAFFGMNKWLQNFAYKTNISWWVFALSGLSIIAVSLLTLSFQTIKAATANPVKSLRAE
jgi:ABC-type antimicrobial peptide transport system permease subunit